MHAAEAASPAAAPPRLQARSKLAAGWGRRRAGSTPWKALQALQEAVKVYVAVVVHL
jgi:hypothetical protein